MSRKLDLIDTHAHLQDESFAESLPAVIARARDAGVGQMIAIGITAEDSRAVVALAQGHPGVVFAAVGVQPNHAGEASQADWEKIVALASEPGVVAIGETGLDRFWDRAVSGAAGLV